MDKTWVFGGQAKGIPVALTVKKVLRQIEPGKFIDREGLYLQVINPENRSWTFRYKRGGKEHWMGLGSVKTCTLDQARERARVARQQVWDNIDPIAVRKAEKRAFNNIKTLQECVDGYLAARAVKWTAKLRDDFISNFTNYVYPVCGNRPVDSIEQTLVMQIIEPIWLTKNPTASKLRGRLEEVLNWATVLGYRKGENPARLAGNLELLLPCVAEIETTHHAALPFTDLPAFMKALRAIDGVPARALELTVLCATRTAETIEAKWDEINFESKTWTIPAARMKGGIEHRIPLSARAIEILQSLPRMNGFVFPAGKGDGHLSKKGMVRLLQRMGYKKQATVHGFRSCFRTWSSELTSYPNEVLEMALAHKIENRVEAAYRRGDLLIKRTRLMEDWSGYCASTPATVLTMPPLRKRA
jgi:integrase